MASDDQCQNWPSALLLGLAVRRGELGWAGAKSGAGAVGPVEAAELEAVRAVARAVRVFL